jgi:hypothetical protein
MKKMFPNTYFTRHRPTRIDNYPHALYECAVVQLCETQREKKKIFFFSLFQVENAEGC